MLWFPRREDARDRFFRRCSATSPAGEGRAYASRLRPRPSHPSMAARGLAWSTGVGVAPSRASSRGRGRRVIRRRTEGPRTLVRRRVRRLAALASWNTPSSGHPRAVEPRRQSPRSSTSTIAKPSSDARSLVDRGNSTRSSRHSATQGFRRTRCAVVRGISERDGLS